MSPNNTMTEKLARVRAHMEAEASKSTEETLATMSDEPRILANGSEIAGQDAISAFYDSTFAAFPDLQIELTSIGPCRDEVVIEATLNATHLGDWQGLAATGKRVRVPLCTFFKFEEDLRIAEERMYIDWSMVYAQLQG